MMEISDSTSTPRELKTKRKSDESNDEINTEFDSKRTRLTQEASEPQPSTSQVTEDATIPESSSARELPKRLAKKAIARDKEVPMEVMHPKKFVNKLRSDFPFSQLYFLFIRQNNIYNKNGTVDSSEWFVESACT